MNIAQNRFKENGQIHVGKNYVLKTGPVTWRVSIGGGKRVNNRCTQRDNEAHHSARPSDQTRALECLLPSGITLYSSLFQLVGCRVGRINYLANIYDVCTVLVGLNINRRGRLNLSGKKQSPVAETLLQILHPIKFYSSPGWLIKPGWQNTTHSCGNFLAAWLAFIWNKHRQISRYCGFYN